MSEKIEFWDIYDANKQKTGRTMKRNDWCLQDGEYHLTVLGVIMRPDGKYLISRRVMTKSWAPGWWEVPGGAAQAGEDSYDAACREVEEETGIPVKGCKYTLAHSYSRENPGEGDNYFVDIYLFEKDFTEADVHMQEEETLEYKIATLDEIREIAEQGIFLHFDSMRPVFER